MNIISRLLGRSPAASGETRAFAQYLPTIFGGGFFSGASDAGPAVSEETALTASTVWAAVQCISDAFAALPIHVLQQKDGEVQGSHALHRLLHDAPNEYMGTFVFRQVLMVNALLWGNAYAAIEKDEMGRTTGLYPLRSRDTRPARTPDGSLVYQHRTSDGFTHTLRPDQVFHVMGISFDGITGINAIEYARNTVGLSLALSKFASKFYSNGAQLGGVIESPPMDDEAMEKFVASWKKKYAGPENAFRVAMLPGMKFHPTSSEPDKAQALESRKAQVLEIARIFKIPPHKLGDYSEAKWANIEHAQLEFAQETLMPWVVRFEQEADRKLLLEREKPILEVRLNLDSVLRADTKTRMESYKMAIEAGVYTRNEARKRENLPPLAGGDTLLVPLNMTPVGKEEPKRTKPDDAVVELLTDTARHLLVIERNAIERMVKKHLGDLESFTAAVTEFYVGHAEKVAQRMKPALRIAGNATPPEEYAATWCTRNRDFILQASQEFLLSRVEESIESLTERAESIAQITANPAPEESHVAAN